MLFITRQVGESIMVGNDVEVSVVAIDRSFVRLDVRHTTLGGRISDLAQGVEVDLPVAGTCTIYHIRGKGEVGLVWLGITAPKEVSVYRKEVYEAIRRGEPT